jgi:cytoskeleton protein RodZ
MLGTTTDDQDQLDPAEALMREVGAQLRQVRLERGEGLDDVAKHLRIKATYLFGIEQGDLSMMPGRTYALGFLRSYADYLGFDGNDLITQIKSTVADLTDKTRLRIRTPLPESRLPKTPFLVLSLVAIAGIYAGWSYLHHGGQTMIETVAEVPGNLRTFALDAVRGDGRPTGGASVTETPEPDVQAGQAGATVSVEPPPATSGDSTAEAPPAAAGQATPPEAGPPAAQTLARANPAEPSDTVVQATPPTAGPAAPEQQIGASGGAGPETGRPEAGASQTAGVDVSPHPGSPPADAVLPALGPPLYDHPRVKAGEPANGASGTVDVPGQAEQSGGSGANPPDANQVLARLVPPAASGAAAAPKVFEAENTDARVILRAHDTSWIRVHSASGDYLRTDTMQAGDVFLVPNRSDLALWTGNAGALEVIVDGTTLPPLGGDGSVLRDVSLDPERLRARLAPEKTR